MDLKLGLILGACWQRRSLKDQPCAPNCTTKGSRRIAAVPRPQMDPPVTLLKLSTPIDACWQRRSLKDLLAETPPEMHHWQKGTGAPAEQRKLDQGSRRVMSSPSRGAVTPRRRSLVPKAILQPIRVFQTSVSDEEWSVARAAEEWSVARAAADMNAAAERSLGFRQAPETEQEFVEESEEPVDNVDEVQTEPVDEVQPEPVDEVQPEPVDVVEPKTVVFIDEGEARAKVPSPMIQQQTINRLLPREDFCRERLESLLANTIQKARHACLIPVA